MTTIVQSTGSQTYWGTDNKISRGMGELARNLSQHLSNSVLDYYSLSEALLEYPPAFHVPLATISTSLIERITQKQLSGTLTEIFKLLTWDNGWNSYDAPKPDSKAVTRAAQWIGTLFLEVVDLGWIEPNVTAGLEGEVVFEWWNGQHKLTIYVAEENTEYIQVWGTDKDAKITDGDIKSIHECWSLWKWLVN